ncbi:sensor histidine kinase [Caldalkalibacillus salinus]|uniref:sensor histidine kinase n=1 Tax=Caldalkalibacillus salinus TaxID=2803787 RepID=UPI001924E380|nr:histidine kinase [Caldalkalibacillus salinus]
MLRYLRQRHTLRQQILMTFLVVMILVLVIVGMSSYYLVSDMITDNAEQQISQTAVEASGRMDSLYQQINQLSLQVATHRQVQRMLLEAEEGQTLHFVDRQHVMQTIHRLQVYTNGLTTFELYTRNLDKVVPLDTGSLDERLPRYWVEQAEKERGRLVWVGKDPQMPSHFLAVRRVSLIDRHFTSGGYLLTQVTPDYLQFKEPLSPGTEMILVDQSRDVMMATTEVDSVMVGAILDHQSSSLRKLENGYIAVKHTSDITGWTVIILTPRDTLTEGVRVIRDVIMVSAVLGFFIFAILSYFLSALITKPIRRLIEAMKKGQGGHLSTNNEHAATVEINELNLTYNNMVEEINHLIQVVYEKELIRSKTELKALQSQIHPHFLFNTLNALYWALEEHGEEALAEYVVAMSELFRYTMGNDEWVELDQELQHIAQYLQLMELRLGDRFEWELKVPEGYSTVKIPKLLIQPLVENALVHGIRENMGNGKVSIIVAHVPSLNALSIRIIDNGVGMEDHQQQKMKKAIEQGRSVSTKGNGMAIVNVHKRLQLYYGNHRSVGVDISSKPGQGTCCEINIPLSRGEYDEKEHPYR